MDSLEINKEKFFKAAARIEHPGKRALLAWLERETDFFEAPASSKHHLAWPGGLVVHSLNVWCHLDEIVNRDLMDPAAPDFCDTMLRNTFTSNLLSNGAPPKDVQELLGLKAGAPPPTSRRRSWPSRAATGSSRRSRPSRRSSPTETPRRPSRWPSRRARSPRRRGTGRRVIFSHLSCLLFSKISSRYIQQHLR